MSTENEDADSTRVVRKNEKLNLPDKTEKRKLKHKKMLP
jgi:hypothetical protein